MYGLNLDFNTIFGVWMAGAVLMVPLLAFAARFGLVPLLDALTRMRAVQVGREWEDEANARFSRLERRIADLSETMSRQSAETSVP